MTLAQQDDAYLTHAGEWPYRFDVPGGPSLVLNDADDDGSLWACDEPDGWGEPIANTPAEERPYGDGSYPGDTTYEALPLTWTGTTICPDRATARAAINRLRAVCSSRVAVLYTQQEEPHPLSLWVRASGQLRYTSFDGRGFDWTFTMIAHDPFRFDAAQAAIELSTALPLDPPGRVYNRTYPYVYGGGAVGRGSLVFGNAGDEWAQARYRLVGPVAEPRLVNQTTGEAAGWTLTLDAGAELVVDTRTELVTLNGTPYYSDRVPGFVFPRLAPGQNVIRWSGSGIPDPRARLYLSAASTWR